MIAIGGGPGAAAPAIAGRPERRGPAPAEFADTLTAVREPPPTRGASHGRAAGRAGEGAEAGRADPGALALAMSMAGAAAPLPPPSTPIAPRERGDERMAQVHERMESSMSSTGGPAKVEDARSATPMHRDAAVGRSPETDRRGAATESESESGPVTASGSGSGTRSASVTGSGAASGAGAASGKGSVAASGASAASGTGSVAASGAGAASGKGSVAASGAGAASGTGSGTGSASGSGSASASGSGSGTGSGSASGAVSVSTSGSEPVASSSVATLAEQHGRPTATPLASSSEPRPHTAALAAERLDSLDGWEPGRPPARVDRARLVVGDEGDRVIVSVAVRHGVVDVAIRADDHRLNETIAAAKDELGSALGRHGLALANQGADSGGRDGRSSSPRTFDRPAGPVMSDDAEPEPPAAAPVRDPHLRARA